MDEIRVWAVSRDGGEEELFADLDTAVSFARAELSSGGRILSMESKMMKLADYYYITNHKDGQ